MNNSLTKNGGTLEVSYTLDFNNDLVSENKFKITVEEKEKFENEVDCYGYIRTCCTTAKKSN